MKKLLAAVLSALLVVVMSMALVACVNNGENSGGNGGGSGTQQGGGNEGGGGSSSQLPAVDTTISDAALKVNLDGHKLYVTSIGQSAVYDTIVNLFTANVGLASGTDFTENKVLRADEVAVGDTVVLATAASSKGMGAGSATDPATELQRARDFAAKDGVNLIVVQTNGTGGRGTSSDPYFEILCPKALVTLIVEGANSDNKFSEEWCKNTPLYLYKRASSMANSFKFIFGV